MLKSKLLLHVCCAPCSPYVVELLRKEYSITAYFYDPNIHPEEEYLFRLEEMKRFCKKIHLDIITAEYDVDRWFKMVEGHEDDPERGERCRICFRMRLEKAVWFAKENGFPTFATVLSVSPHKDARAINQIGKELGEEYHINFFEADFKKKNGFKISVGKSKEYDLKRQNYCGCIFSRDSLPTFKKNSRRLENFGSKGSICKSRGFSR